MQNEIVRQEQLAAMSVGLEANKRLALCASAHDDLLTFAQLTSPDPQFPLDLEMSRYKIALHHRYLASVLMSLEMGLLPRVIISWPPRHGKTELVARKFIPWTMGRDPSQHIIFATYNEEFALDHGRDIRATMQSSMYRQIFGDVRLQTGSAASDRLQTTAGGVAFFVGRGGSLMGRGAHKLLMDDIVKDREEADSRNTRNKMWSWLTDVAMSRLMNKLACVLIITTRWHDDDIVGRLTDPRNPFYDERIAKQWVVINIPALAMEDDVLGRDIGEPLWGERFSADYLEDMRRLNPESFSAIWQGRPSLAEGSFFTRQCIVPYKRNELPHVSRLKLYGASDHATSTLQHNDKSCLGLVGVDEARDIWLLPDLFWRRASTATVVEAMLEFFRQGPLLWWAEKDQIFRSIEPFLRTRMLERGIYAAIHQVPSNKDKEARAQPIQARMSMGRVRIPAFAPWYQDALDELFSFPHGARDDFVDFMSLIGRGLALQVPAKAHRGDRDVGPKVGTFGHLKAQSTRTERRHRAYGGF